MAFQTTQNSQGQNPVGDNSVSYTASPNDTFAANYKANVQLDTPLAVNIQEDGIKEIKPRIEQLDPLPNDEVLTNMPEAIMPTTPTLTPQQTQTSPQGVEFVDPVVDVSLANMVQDRQTKTMEELTAKYYSLQEVLMQAIQIGASDVHFTVGYRAIVRVDGHLKTFKSAVSTQAIIREYALELIKARPDIDLENIKEADLTYAFGTRRFRVNIFKQMGSYSIVCRVIPEKISTIEDLNLPPIVREFTKFPNGLVLVTGPTGSGKSTTIASILNHINLTYSKHLVTLEDPIEYVFPKALSLIDQREYAVDFDSWANALKSVLRQDPDIVLIGEMRDLESIEAALQVADTGHLVFGTLHTNGAAQTIERIVDVFPDHKQEQIRIQLSSVIRAVISQKLIPLARAGRIPATEIMIANPAVRNSIRDKKTFLVDNIIQTSSDEGMISMEKSLVNLVRQGMISTETAKSLSLRPKEIDILLKK